MRRLAAELGVEAMTLYYHVPNKAAILNEITERVAEEFELPGPDAAWRPALRAMALSAYRALARHPWAPQVMLGSTEIRPNRLRHMEAMLGTLERAGFPPRMADHAYHAIEGHVMGFTLWVRGMNLGSRDELEALASGFLGSLPAGEYPHIRAHVEHHLAPPDPEDEGSFAFALDLLLDGLERLEADRST